MREDAQMMLEPVEKEIRELLPQSVAHYEQARQVVPGGATRSRFWWPVPTYAVRAEGPYLYDLDGRRYLDCNLGFGPLILGHRHERVERAIAEQLTRGIQFGAPGTGEYELARRIVSSVPGAERVIFVSSGPRRPCRRFASPAPQRAGARSPSSRVAGTGGRTSCCTAIHSWGARPIAPRPSRTAPGYRRRSPAPS
ncbi:MAG: aminotransferase class III-fold pyridoxal phosphate-dependent enzyme [Streptosporangiales bacterium]|nr:aminotransferase class III-fold pyridoxal phosphate-dependent enzyme [Streptosporangiales bacterium]